MNEVLTGTERILATPLPLAYSIAISQITWLYVLILPFQLYTRLGWITIPATLGSFSCLAPKLTVVVSAYIILGLAAIGREIENPFGNDVNDLPLESYCEQLSSEFDIITATPPLKMDQFVDSSENLVLYPLTMTGYSEWKSRSVSEIRDALKTRSIISHSAASAAWANAEENIAKVNEA
jgi:putative membrane protein